MRKAVPSLISIAMCSFSLVCLGQADSPATPQTAAQPAASAAAPAAGSATISYLLQAPLDGLQQSLTALKLEKWKGGNVRAEATSNVASIQKDLQGPLPALIAEADAAPGSLAKALPVSRNLDALYDVLVRVVDAARIAAPADQVDQLVQAMTAMEKGRLAFNDQMQATAEGAEKQVVALRAAVVKAQAPAPAPAPPACPAAPAPKPTAKKKPVKKKPAPLPATTQPAAKPAPQ